MLEGIKKFFHHIINPHCEDCLQEKEDKWQKEHECRNCEALLIIIEKQRQDYQLLIEKLMHRDVENDIRPEHEIKPILPRRVPWSVQRQTLEREDRIKAAKLAEEKEAATRITNPTPSQDIMGASNIIGANKTVEQLESELGVTTNVQTNDEVH